MGIFRRDEDALGKARREAEEAGQLGTGESFEVGDVGTVDTGQYGFEEPEAPVPTRVESPTGDPRGWQGAPGPLGGGGTIGSGFPFWIPLVIVGVVLALGGVIVGAVREGFDSFDDIELEPRSDQPDVPGISPPATETERDSSPTTPPPAGSSPGGSRPRTGSLVEPRNVARALVAFRERGRRALTLRIANDRIDATVFGREGMEIVQFTHAGLRIVTRTQNRPPVEGIDLRSISSRTPQRLVSRARAQANGAGLDYLATSGVGTGGRNWLIALKGGAQFVSDGDSGPLRKIG